MRDLFRRLVSGGAPPRAAGSAEATAASSGQHSHAIPGAPFTRDELPAVLGEDPPLAECVAGRSDVVSPEFGKLALVEAGLWLTFLRDQPRANAAFEAAANLEVREAQLGSPEGVAMARFEGLPVSAGARAGTFLSLPGSLPVLLPPADLTEALTGRARQRLLNENR
jgi:hypothetical protein